MHGVAPVLVVVAAPRLSVYHWLQYAYLWSAMYLAVLAMAASAGWDAIPYPFLQPSRIGWTAAISVFAALAVLIAVVSTVLCAISHLTGAGRKGCIAAE
jgi:hypothetical protein